MSDNPTPPERPQGEPEEAHPCDEALGEIHQCAIALAMIGHHDQAVLIARAHGTIQSHLVAEMAERERLIKENGDLIAVLRRIYDSASQGKIFHSFNDHKWKKDSFNRILKECQDALAKEPATEGKA